MGNLLSKSINSKCVKDNIASLLSDKEKIIREFSDERELTFKDHLLFLTSGICCDPLDTVRINKLFAKYCDDITDRQWELVTDTFTRLLDVITIQTHVMTSVIKLQFLLVKLFDIEVDDSFEFTYELNNINYLSDDVYNFMLTAIKTSKGKDMMSLNEIYEHKKREDPSLTTRDLIYEDLISDIVDVVIFFNLSKVKNKLPSKSKNLARDIYSLLQKQVGKSNFTNMSDYAPIECLSLMSLVNFEDACCVGGLNFVSDIMKLNKTKYFSLGNYKATEKLNSKLLKSLDEGYMKVPTGIEDLIDLYESNNKPKEELQVPTNEYTSLHDVLKNEPAWFIYSAESMHKDILDNEYVKGLNSGLKDFYLSIMCSLFSTFPVQLLKDFNETKDNKTLQIITSLISESYCFFDELFPVLSVNEKVNCINDCFALVNKFRDISDEYFMNDLIHVLYEGLLRASLTCAYKDILMEKLKGVYLEMYHIKTLEKLEVELSIEKDKNIVLTNKCNNLALNTKQTNTRDIHKGYYDTLKRLDTELEKKDKEIEKLKEKLSRATSLTKKEEQKVIEPQIEIDLSTKNVLIIANPISIKQYEKIKPNFNLSYFVDGTSNSTTMTKEEMTKFDLVLLQWDYLPHTAMKYESVAKKSKVKFGYLKGTNSEIWLSTIRNYFK